MRLKVFLFELHAVADEFRICRTAALRLQSAIEEDPTLAGRLAIPRAVLAQTIRRLEHTYTVRVFSAFEGALREIWANAFRRTTEPPVRDLLDALAAANSFMPAHTLARAHRVRELRNSIVHLNAVGPMPIAFGDCARNLQAYLSFMPRQW